MSMRWAALWQWDSWSCVLAFIIYKFGSDWIDVVLPPAAMGPVVALIGLELSGTRSGYGGAPGRSGGYEKCDRICW